MSEKEKKPEIWSIFCKGGGIHPIVQVFGIYTVPYKFIGKVQYETLILKALTIIHVARRLGLK